MLEVLTIAIIMYPIPMVIALAKGCDSKASMIAISLLLGWLPFVTLVCIFWAICGSTSKKKLANAQMLAKAIADAR